MDTTTVRFDQFRLDLARRELWRDDQRLRTPARVFDCIAYLIEHRDRAVSRDELIFAVWGNADISDNMLDQTVLRARRLLGDTGDERRIIITQPRFGYLWGVPVDLIPDAPAPAAEEANARPGSRRSWLWLVAVAGLLSLTLTAWLVVDRYAEQSGALAARTDRALVLPVAVDAGAEYAWVRLGLMDLITQRLRTAGLGVVPSDNVVALLRGSDSWSQTQISAAAGFADARLIVRPQAEPVGQRWRVTLTWAHEDTHGQTAIGEAADILAAARIATDIMARRLGLDAPRAMTLVGDEAIAGLLQQVEAAMLADDMDGALALLDGLGQAQQARPDVRYQRAIADFRQGRLASAQAALEALLAETPVLEDVVFHARVLNGLGNVMLRRDEWEAAQHHADAAIELLAGGEPQRELGRALTGRAILHSLQHRYRAAVADFSRARVILESVGDRLALARVDANIGILEGRRDRFAEAVPILIEAADALAAFHDLSAELFTRVSLGYAQLAQRDPRSALAGQARLRDLAETEPDAERRRYANLARAQVLIANGDLEEGVALLERTASDARAASDRVLLGWALAVAAESSLREGRPERALELVSEALGDDWEDEHPRSFARAWLTWARAQVSLGEVESVRILATHADAWARARETRVAAIYAALVAALAATDDGDAGEHFERALSEAEAGRVPDDLLRVSEVYADYLIEQGRLVQAGEVIARTAGWAERDFDAALLQLRLYHALAQPAAWHQALTRAQALAGERRIPFELTVIPTKTD